MTDTVEKPDAPSSHAPKKSRGRPKSPTPETPQQRIERLQAELQQAHEAKKIAEQQRDSIVGKVVVAHALANADYRRQLASLLRAEIKSKADLTLLAEVLA